MHENAKLFIVMQMVQLFVKDELPPDFFILENK